METSQPTAITKVLNTYEFLQTIISFLPPTDILTNRRVCTYWQSVIETSPDIRKRLFLMPDDLTVAPLSVSAHEAQSLIQYNVNLRINPLCFTEELGRKIGPGLVDAQSLSLRIHFSPRRSGVVRRIHNEQVLYGIQGRMYLTQPPCTTIALIVNGLRETTGYLEPTNCFNWCTLHDTSGVKLDLVLTTAIRMIETMEISEDIETFCGVLTFCAPLTDVEKALWEAKNQRADRLADMVRDLKMNRGIAKGTKRSDIEALWKARMANADETTLKEEAVDAASDAVE